MCMRVFIKEEESVRCVNVSTRDVKVVNKPQEPSNSSWWQQKVLMGNVVQIEEPAQTSADSWPIISENVSLDDIVRPQCEAALQTTAGKSFSMAQCNEGAL